MEYRIRLADYDDLEAIGMLWEQMIEEIRNNRPDLGIPKNTRAFFRDFAGAGMAAGCCAVYIACGTGILGFVTGQIVTPEAPFLPQPYGYVTALFVRREFRRKGIGRALVRSITGWFGSKGVDNMELHVYAGDRGALEFWEHLGFCIFGFRMGRKVFSVLAGREMFAADGNPRGGIR